MPYKKDSTISQSKIRSDTVLTTSGVVRIDNKLINNLILKLIIYGCTMYPTMEVGKPYYILSMLATLARPDSAAGSRHHRHSSALIRNLYCNLKYLIVWIRYWFRDTMVIILFTVVGLIFAASAVNAEEIRTFRMSRSKYIVTHWL